MKLDLGTVANVIKHSGSLIDRLRGGNTMQTIEKLKFVLDNSVLLMEVMAALDGLDQNLRVFKMATLDLSKANE